MSTALHGDTVANHNNDIQKVKVQQSTGRPEFIVAMAVCRVLRKIENVRLSINKFCCKLKTSCIVSPTDTQLHDVLYCKVNTLKKVNETLNVFLFFCIPQLLQFRKKLDTMEEKNGTKGTVKRKNSLYLFLVFDCFSTKRSCLCNCKMNTRWKLQEVQFVGTAEGKQSPQARIEMSNFTTLKSMFRSSQQLSLG